MRSLTAGVLALVMIPAWAGQNCNSKIPGRFSNRYTLDASAETVTDRVTGLIWQRCPLGDGLTGNNQCGPAQKYTWGEALNWYQVGSTNPNAEKYAKLKNAGWRVPNIKELQSLAELHCVPPSIDLTAFPAGSKEYYYWSNTPDIAMVDHIVKSNTAKPSTPTTATIPVTETIQRYHRAYYISFGSSPEGAALARIAERPPSGDLKCYEIVDEKETTCEFPVLLVKDPAPR